MKRILIFVLIIFSGYENFAQKDSVEKPRMKQYFFVMLERGPNRTQDSTTAAKIQEGHIANIKRMANEGKCLLAGPFGDDGNWRGLFVLDVPTEEDAKKELAQDPAISSGRLIYEIHPWWTQTGNKKFN